jgi:selenide,water dikinase
MTTLNKLGELFGKLDQVRAMTDVTGFGLLGHLAEMCEGSGLSAVVEFAKVPLIPSVPYYLNQNCIPGGTHRNWSSYGQKVSTLSDVQRCVLADPQTSGGLLVAVTEEGTEEFEAILSEHKIPVVHHRPFGFLKAKDGGPLISVI